MISFTIPIRTVSEANSSEHWSISSKRHRFQQMLVRAAFNTAQNVPNLPAIVKLTRLAPRCLDDDNLLTALKYVRDELSDCLLPEKSGWYKNKRGKIVQMKGRGDNDPRIKWEYGQEKSKQYAVRVEISNGKKL